MCGWHIKYWLPTLVHIMYVSIPIKHQLNNIYQYIKLMPYQIIFSDGSCIEWQIFINVNFDRYFRIYSSLDAHVDNQFRTHQLIKYWKKYFGHNIHLGTSCWLVGDWSVAVVKVWWLRKRLQLLWRLEDDFSWSNQSETENLRLPANTKSDQSTISRQPVFDIHATKKMLSTPILFCRAVLPVTIHTLWDCQLYVIHSLIRQTKCGFTDCSYDIQYYFFIDSYIIQTNVPGIQTIILFLIM